MPVKMSQTMNVAVGQAVEAQNACRSAGEAAARLREAMRARGLRSSAKAFSVGNREHLARAAALGAGSAIWGRS